MKQASKVLIGGKYNRPSTRRRMSRPRQARLIYASDLRNMSLAHIAALAVGAVCAGALILLAAWAPASCMGSLHDDLTLPCAFVIMGSSVLACTLPAYITARTVVRSGLATGLLISVGGFAIAVVVDRLTGANVAAGSDLVLSVLLGLQTFVLPGTLAGGVGELHRTRGRGREASCCAQPSACC